MSWRDMAGLPPKKSEPKNLIHLNQQTPFGEGVEGNLLVKMDIIPRVQDLKPETQPAPLPPSNVPPDLEEGLCRLNEVPMPRAYEKPRWKQIKADAAALTIEHCETLATAGWTVADLYSVHKTKPDVRLECAGIVPLIMGRKVETVTDKAIILRANDGARLTIYRKATKLEQALLWELNP